MSLKECYDKMGADYEDVLSRLRRGVRTFFQTAMPILLL